MPPATAPALAASRGQRLAIAVVTETYPPEINGVANTLWHLVSGLTASGHEVEVVRPRQDRERDGPEATGETAETAARLRLVPGLPIPGYRGLRFGLPVFWRLRHAWHRSRPDVVYIATQGPLGHAALAAARGLGIPTLTGFHTQFHQYSQHYGLGLLNGPIMQTLKHFHNRSDMTLVPTRELKQELERLGFLRVRVFGRGVDVALFNPRRRDPHLRTTWGCGPDQLAVLSVGRIAAEKNLDLAIESFAAIRRHQPDARLVLVGDGPALPGIQREHPDILTPGAKIGPELASYYASSDLFLFPSETETYGNVVPEAMASGLPAIAFDYAAAHALIDSGRNGVTLPVGERAAFIDASCRVAAAPAWRAAMGTAARRATEGIGWDRILRGVEQRMIDVISPAAGRGGLPCDCGFNA